MVKQYLVVKYTLGRYQYAFLGARTSRPHPPKQASRLF